MGVSIVKRSTRYNLRREDKSLVFDEHVLGINKNGNYYIIHKRPNISNLCDSEGNIIFPTDGKIEVVNAFIKYQNQSDYL